MIPDRDYTKQEHVNCPIHGPSPMFVIGPEYRAVYCNRCVQEHHVPAVWDALAAWLDKSLERLPVMPADAGEEK